jgi:hypothetical protein
MGFMDLFRRSAPAVEKRSAGSGFTSEIMAAREAYISGRRGIAELTGTAQSCISLWENGLSMADVVGTDMLDCRKLALMGRSLALRGESVFLITEGGLVPASDWDLKTRDGKPTAYRVSIPEAGGGRTETALAAEVFHVRIGSDPAAPYYGSAPLKRASLTAGLLNAVEATLAEVYEFAPIGSQIVPMPETGETDLNTLGRSFRGQRGRVLLRESVTVSAAGGPTPQTDWKPADVTPNLEQAMTKESLDAARDAVCGVFGVLPGLFNSATTGPLVREAQRHLAMWTLQPVAEFIAAEAKEKLGGEITLDCLTPTQAFDAGGRARALTTIIQAMAAIKEAGLPPSTLDDALKALAWD